VSGGDELKPDTRLAHAGRRPEWTHGVVNPPVYRASTCVFETMADLDRAVADPDAGLYYGRRGTPTQWALAEALTELEPGAAGTQLFPSGVAAIAGALLAVVRTSDHVLLPDSAYEPTRLMARGLLAPMGVETEFYDPLIGAGIAALLRPNTACLYLESPGSLTFEVQDVPAMAAAARAAGVMTILDNTWATPLLFPALGHGVDISVQSLTKFVVGHSDVVLGAATANAATWPKLRSMALRLGQTGAPDDSYLALRGLRTLGVRMARHGASALTVAKALAAHPKVARVMCPGLPGDPGHALWTRDFKGYSSLFSIVLKGGRRAALAPMVDGLRHFSMGFSFGGYESLALPVDPAPLRSATRWSAEGPLLRLHIGLEDPDDLIADLLAGLDRFAGG
jgi:cysteine-S-conjugate beta-lyase